MVKLIAADMDGTFLRDDKTYDQNRFKKQMEQMKQQGIRFVAASGNQRHHLNDIFKGDTTNVSYISDNGAVVQIGDKVIFEQPIAANIVPQIVQELERNPILQNALVVLSGKKDAYISKHVSKEIKREASKYYRHIEQVDNLLSVNDTIFKIALGFEKDTLEIEKLFQEKFGKWIRATSSGYGGVDLIHKDISKAIGLNKLLEHWQLDSEQCAVFGDGENDIEMLEVSKYSYAMKNASDKVKQASKYHTTYDNNHDGVLHEIDLLLEKRAILHR